MYICVSYDGGQKMALEKNPLILELQVAVSHCVGPGN